MKNSIQILREKSPLVHCITNYVTVNFVANTLIACGASPIMADEKKEVEQMTSIANALVINIGTLNKRTVAAMKISIKTANAKNIPIVLDPVGVGATAYRMEVVKEFLKHYRFSVIRGNISEIKALMGLSCGAKGVDATLDDMSDDLASRVALAQNLSAQTGAVIVITGKEDIVADKKQSFVCKNGDIMMKDITGSGCMLTSLCAAYCGSNDNYLEASIDAVLCATIAGELAKQKTVEQNAGNASFVTNFIDEIYLMNDEKIAQFGKFNEFLS